MSTLFTTFTHISNCIRLLLSAKSYLPLCVTNFLMQTLYLEKKAQLMYNCSTSGLAICALASG